MLDANNVHFAYNKKSHLFQGLDFQLEAGKICGLLGKNGAGKSSLLRLISGAQFSQQGSITFQNNDITNRRVSDLRDMYILQEDAELPKSTVKAYVEIYAPFYPNFDRAVFDHVLQKFELPSEGKLKELSFGQMKKFHLAFALATQVKLLILDEPTNGLDIPSKSIFRSVVSESLGEHQSIIISTHQIRDLGQLLDRIMIIEKGKIILNEDLYNLAEQFQCTFIAGKSVPAESLYHEAVAGGHVALLPTTSEAPGEIDIEILFNAIISNPSILTKNTTHGI